MKITDYAILFLGIMEAFMAVYEVEDRVLFNVLLCREEINRTMDNVTVSALEKGYIADIHSNINGDQYIIDETIVVESFIAEMSILLYGADTDINRARVWEHIVGMFIIDNSQYIMCGKDMGEWMEFSDLNHEGKVQEIEEKMNDNIEKKGYKVTFPSNAGEYYSQTIADYAVIVAYVIDDSNYIQENEGGCILSGAAIKQK